LNEVANRVKEESQKGGLLRKPLNQVFSSANTGGGSAEAELQQALGKLIGSTESDTEHLNALKALSASLGKRDGEEVKPVYMAAVSPWFFTHYGANSFNKNVSYPLIFPLTLKYAYSLCCCTVHLLVRPAPLL
jgi:hypothetical protein